MSLIVKTENDLKVSCKIVLYDESFDFSSFKSIGYVYIFYEKSLNLYQFIASIFANQNFLRKIWQKSTQKLIKKKKSPFFHFFFLEFKCRSVAFSTFILPIEPINECFSFIIWLAKTKNNLCFFEQL